MVDAARDDKILECDSLVVIARRIKYGTSFSFV